MFEQSFKITANGVKGVMPSGEEKDFPSIEAYKTAYSAEENEIADELARMYEENFVELPEDWVA